MGEVPLYVNPDMSKRISSISPVVSQVGGLFLMGEVPLNQYTCIVKHSVHVFDLDLSNRFLV